ncbi:hypothetical protein U1Q18_047639 [Sarracenia purpurea var. burkii]
MKNLSALAPQPVVTGYSLVGVYPCAVWKPSPHNSDEIVANCFCNNHGPIRSNRLASTVRTTPYPPVQLYNSNSSIIETCRCRTVTEDLVSSAESAVNNTHVANVVRTVHLTNKFWRSSLSSRVWKCTAQYNHSEQRVLFGCYSATNKGNFHLDFAIFGCAFA